MPITEAARLTPARKVVSCRDSKDWRGHKTHVLTLDCEHTLVRRASGIVPTRIGCGKCAADAEAK